MDTSTTKKPKFTIENNILVGEQVPLPDGPLNCGQVVLDLLSERPDFIGEVDAVTGRKVTFAEMREKIIKCAIWLKKQGVKRGDVVGLCIDVHVDAYAPLFACACIGAVCYPADYDIPIAYTRLTILSASPKIIFVHAKFVERLEKITKECGIRVKVVVIEDVPGVQESIGDILEAQTDDEVAEFRCAEIKDPKEVCLILCTSGTSGTPKSTQLTHTTMRVPLLIDDASDMTNRLCWFNTGFRWMYGVLCALRSINAPSTQLIVPSDDHAEKVCRIIVEHKLEWIGVDPYLVKSITKHGLLRKYPMTSLKVIEIVGSPFPKDAQDEVRRLLPHVLIKQVYGSTDIGNCCTLQWEGSHSGSCGPVTRSTRLRIADLKTGESLGPNRSGEICVKNLTMLVGYLNNPQAYAKAVDEDGWLHTGDVGYYDEDGELYISGRLSELITCKSNHISPVEIETLLESHPAVATAAVVPVPDDIDQYVPFAFVTKVPGMEVTEEELIRLVDENLSYFYRLSKGLKFIDKMPLTRTGKVARTELKEMAKAVVNAKINGTR